MLNKVVGPDVYFIEPHINWCILNINAILGSPKQGLVNINE